MITQSATVTRSSTPSMREETAKTRSHGMKGKTAAMSATSATEMPASMSVAVETTRRAWS